VREFVDDLRDLNVTPNIAQNTTNRSSAIDARTTRHPGYAISQQKKRTAQRLAMLLDDNEHAIAMVNAEEGDPSACAVETVAFVRGASLATVRNKAEAFAVIEILVVGVDLESGFRSIPPNVYFMLVKIDERDA
jgi:hypothetical protein